MRETYARPRPRLPALHRAAHLLAMFAIVAAALVPSLTRLLAADAISQGRAVALCTSQGMRFVVLSTSIDATASTTAAIPDNPAPDAPVDLPAGSEHCPWCGTHVPLAMLPTASAACPAPLGHATTLVAVDDAPPTRVTYAPAHARGPPRSS